MLPSWEQIQAFLVQLSGVALAWGLPVLAVYGIRWLNANRKAIETRLHVEQYDGYVVKAVQAVEQTLKSQAGQDKRNAAINLIQDWLTTRGVKLPVGEIVTAVEAAVLTELDHSPESTPAKTESAVGGVRP